MNSVGKSEKGLGLISRVRSVGREDGQVGNNGRKASKRAHSENSLVVVVGGHLKENRGTARRLGSRLSSLSGLLRGWLRPSHEDWYQLGSLPTQSLGNGLRASQPVPGGHFHLKIQPWGPEREALQPREQKSSLGSPSLLLG